MNRLKGFDLLALGFMTFALFLGAGNIIFPPSAGMAAGAFIWQAALGFLLTGVGMPLLTVDCAARQCRRHRSRSGGLFGNRTVVRHTAYGCRFVRDGYRAVQR